ncbi:hypothetical protein TPA0910_64760 [Streptomyces hygroscopicus subsp. sporocinereus]|uniref:Uncharacterized protein n=1 Tax=Streptomyces hygroscopicus TaxID=1912 RepID=A0ABQ3U8V4_STRHY|nr:hypothetical protein TPA0910_64760 [Streptomyces hygroscopicus]
MTASVALLAHPHIVHREAPREHHAMTGARPAQDPLKPPLTAAPAMSPGAPNRPPNAGPRTPDATPEGPDPDPRRQTGPNLHPDPDPRAPDPRTPDAGRRTPAPERRTP